MAVSRQKKTEALDDLKKIFSSGAEVVFANFHGLNVVETTYLRKRLKEAGISYRVAKKTLVKKALAECGFDNISELPGELGFAHALNIETLEVGRQAHGIQKEHDGKFSITGGILENRFLGGEEMRSLSQIPSKKVLYAQFVNIINSPLQGLVISLNKIAESKE